MYQDALLFLTGSWAYPAIEMWLIKHRQMPPAKAMEECVSPRHSISMAG